MHGPAQEDPLVRYHDQTLALGASDDTEWYVGRALEFGGPVLGLTCRTGLATNSLAKARTYDREDAPGTIAVERLARGDALEQMVETAVTHTRRGRTTV